ncbi:MAG TPA: sulfatase-like hydrolase/transferase [Thermoanaerobaculia bacterium]|nr:sulfatase-like hydrolase/transferase [Thermoanaerobaculia bacterium]
MDRHRPVSGLLLSLLLSLPAPALAGAGGREGSAPDLLLVTLDTTRADALGCYGATGARTPTLDGLAVGGVRFDSAWSPAPLTLPAHASLLTGLEPGAHGLRDNGWGVLDPAHRTLAQELSAAGWATAAFVASRVLDRRLGLDRGFDLYDDRMTAERVGQYGYAERDATEVVAAALAWLRTQPAGRPLFVWVHFYDPHAPYEPGSEVPGTLRSAQGGAPGLAQGGASERERYAGEVAAVDRELGRLLAGWPSGRKRVVAAVGDHGEAFGEHGERGHGLFLYRPTLEVPMLVAGEGVPQGKVIRTPVGTRRLAATLLRLLGVASRLPGPPLPLTAEPREAEPIFHETLFPASAYGWSPLAAVTRGPGRAIAAPRPELYDLARDPAEARNLAASPTGEHRRLQRLLLEHLKRHPLDVAPPAPIDPEAAAALRSLGYLSGQSRRSGSLDPKDGVLLLADFEAAGVLLEAAARGDGSAAAAAVGKLEALVAKSPESVPFLARLATAQARAGRLEPALATLDRALHLSPQLDFLHLERGELLLALGHKGAAEAAFRLALELDPRSATARLKLAELALRAGRKEEEETLLREGLAAGTRSALLLARLGEITLARGDLAEADRHLAEATSLLPEWPRAWALWAEVARRQGRPDLAEERRRRARP